jgi:hypothetical protein
MGQRLARTRRMGMSATALGIRWTIGDVSEQGFEALQLSVLGARKVFGAGAAYAICVNSIPVAKARELTGELPSGIEWLAADTLLPTWLRAYFNADMAEGVGWKFAPLRVFPECYELALDNDCILWEMPPAVRAAIHPQTQRCVLAEDTRTCLGQFARLCGPEPRNTGLRGTPAAFDLGASLRRILERCGHLLRSELDEQGLQVAALTCHSPVEVVAAEDVTICSPFPSHSPGLGRCGAHFVGLNARNLPWEYLGRPASQVRRAHWYELRDTVRAHVAAARARSANLS